MSVSYKCFTTYCFYLMIDLLISDYKRTNSFKNIRIYINKLNSLCEVKDTIKKLIQYNIEDSTFKKLCEVEEERQSLYNNLLSFNNREIDNLHYENLAKLSKKKYNDFEEFLCCITSFEERFKYLIDFKFFTLGKSENQILIFDNKSGYEFELNYEIERLKLHREISTTPPNQSKSKNLKKYFELSELNGFDYGSLDFDKINEDLVFLSNIKNELHLLIDIKAMYITANHFDKYHYDQLLEEVHQWNLSTLDNLILEKRLGLSPKILSEEKQSYKTNDQSDVIRGFDFDTQLEYVKSLSVSYNRLFSDLKSCDIKFDFFEKNVKDVIQSLESGLLEKRNEFDITLSNLPYESKDYITFISLLLVEQLIFISVLTVKTEKFFRKDKLLALSKDIRIKNNMLACLDDLMKLRDFNKYFSNDQYKFDEGELLELKQLIITKSLLSNGTSNVNTSTIPQSNHYYQTKMIKKEMIHQVKNSNLSRCHYFMQLMKIV